MIVLQIPVKDMRCSEKNNRKKYFLFYSLFIYSRFVCLFLTRNEFELIFNKYLIAVPINIVFFPTNSK